MLKVFTSAAKAWLRRAGISCLEFCTVRAGARFKVHTEFGSTVHAGTVRDAHGLLETCARACLFFGLGGLGFWVGDSEGQKWLRVHHRRAQGLGR